MKTKELQKLPARLLPWYEANARRLPWRETREPYRVWVSEIMLQQTRVEAVIGYFTRFMEAFPTLSALASADEARVLKLWEGLGYYSRARNLQKAARCIMDEHGGCFPERAAALLKLPGIGAYTAGAVASICFEEPVAAVDGNVLRVAARFLADDTPVDLPAHKKALEAALTAVYPKESCGAFTQALMELGATVCTPKGPSCGACPLSDVCAAKERGTPQCYPVRLPKRDKRVEERTVLLLYAGDALALCKRPDKGLLAGLWELPNLPGTCTPEEAVAAAVSLGVAPVDVVREVRKTHIFTHIRWEMTGYTVRCAEPSGALTWALPEALDTVYTLPTAFRVFLEQEKPES